MFLLYINQKKESGWAFDKPACQLWVFSTNNLSLVEFIR